MFNKCFIHEDRIKSYNPVEEVDKSFDKKSFCCKCWLCCSCKEEPKKCKKKNHKCKKKKDKCKKKHTCCKEQHKKHNKKHKKKKKKDKGCNCYK